MSQRNSGFDRIAADLYETPAWATKLFIDTIAINDGILEPACGTGKMAQALFGSGFHVVAGDIGDYGFSLQSYQQDFLELGQLPPDVRAVITNPPYGIQNRLAVKFIEHALALTKPVCGQVAMLLTADFDHAKGRRHLFAENAAFTARLAIQTRIRWIEDSTGSPSQNHCWFFWDHANRGPPLSLYAEREAA